MIHQEISFTLCFKIQQLRQVGGRGVSFFKLEQTFITTSIDVTILIASHHTSNINLKRDPPPIQLDPGLTVQGIKRLEASLPLMP